MALSNPLSGTRLSSELLKAVGRAQTDWDRFVAKARLPHNGSQDRGLLLAVRQSLPARSKVPSVMADVPQTPPPALPAKKDDLGGFEPFQAVGVSVYSNSISTWRSRIVYPGGLLGTLRGSRRSFLVGKVKLVSWSSGLREQMAPFEGPDPPSENWIMMGRPIFCPAWGGSRHDMAGHMVEAE